MVDRAQILEQIKRSVMTTGPGASVIPYGFYARGDYNEESDIDLLVLIDQEKVSLSDRQRIVYPLYDLELNKGVSICSMVLTGLAK